jgi:hypothetical protein
MLHVSNIVLSLGHIKNEEIMKTFRNIKFIKRDYDCTNIVFCEAETAPNENWIECNASENTLSQLWMENGVRYFGYL